MLGQSCALKSLLKCLVILQLVSWSAAGYYKNNQTLIKLINDKKTSWRAGNNKMRIPLRFSSRVPKLTAGLILQSKSVKTPDSFDAREHWPKCRSIINRIRDQGESDTSWAVATCSMLSDRVCIASNGSTKVHLSADEVITCCNRCHLKWPRSAIIAGKYWIRLGIVTGGEFGSEEGCKPYSSELYKGEDAPDCFHNNCTNKNYSKDYFLDLHNGRVFYFVRPDEDMIRTEIFKYGPVATLVYLNSDLKQYKTGVYRTVVMPVRELQYLKILGWGQEVDDGKTYKYWLAANTWGVGWGLKGFIKFLRGENHCNIERMVVAGRTENDDVFASKMMVRKVAANSSDKRRLSFVEMVLLYMFCILILK